MFLWNFLMLVKYNLGMLICFDVFKVSIFDDKVESDYDVDHKLIQNMFLIRVGAEFIVQMCACYICYSYKEKL